MTSQTTDHHVGGRLRADAAFAPGALTRMGRLAHTENTSGCSKKSPGLGSGGPLTLLLAPHHFVTSGSVMLDRLRPLSEPQVPTRRQP